MHTFTHEEYMNDKWPEKKDDSSAYEESSDEEGRSGRDASDEEGRSGRDGSDSDQDVKMEED